MADDLILHCGELHTYFIYVSQCNNSRKTHAKCNLLGASSDHTSTLGTWKNCLPRNRSLVPEALGIAALEHLRRLYVIKGLPMWH